MGAIGSDNKTLTVTSCGTFTIGLVTAASGNYAAGEKVTATLTVTKAAAPTLTWPAAGSVTYVEALSASTLAGVDNTYGTFAWTNAATVPTVSNSGYEMTHTASPAAKEVYELPSATV